MVFYIKIMCFAGFFHVQIHIHFTQYQTPPRPDEVDCKDSCWHFKNESGHGKNPRNI